LSFAVAAPAECAETGSVHAEALNDFPLGIADEEPAA
jgi:hypothetical protein